MNKQNPSCEAYIFCGHSGSGKTQQAADFMKENGGLDNYSMLTHSSHISNDKTKVIMEFNSYTNATAAVIDEMCFDQVYLVRCNKGYAPGQLTEKKVES